MSLIDFDLVNGTSLQPQTLISKTADGDRAVKMSQDGMLIEYDINSTQKSFEIGQNGFDWTDGTNTYTTTLERISLVQTALSSVELPPNGTTLKINNTLQLNAGSVENADLTQNGLTYTDTIGATSSATWANIIAGTPYPDLNAVLLSGNNAFGQSITGVNNVDLVSINSTSYPPPTPTLGDVMTINNVASTNLNMDNWDIQNVNSINGLTPTTLGLTWGDFTASNVFSNLPNQAYQVFSSPSTTSQNASSFTNFNSSSNEISTLFSNSVQFTENNSGTTTTYATNSIQSTNGTDFTITAGSSANTALRLNCSSLIINGVAYAPAPPPPLRWGYYQNLGQSFIATSGGFTNVGIGSSPIQYLSGMTAYNSYTIAIQFNCWTDYNDNTSSCYISYNNINGSFTGLYDSGNPCPNTTAVGVFPYGSCTQFTIQDTIIFQAGSSGELALELYFGTSAGFSGNYKWSLSAQIVSP